MIKIPAKKPISKIRISIDRLAICFTEPNPEHVKSTCGLLLSDKYTNAIPGIKITNSAKYRVNARIPLPYAATSDLSHPIYFQAGPHLPGLPSYRLEFNPAKMSADGISEMLALLSSIMDPEPLEFFHKGWVTRVDVAVDLPGHSVDDLIVVTKRKQKHGVYSDRHGGPESVYLGTPRSHRLVVYTKKNSKTGETKTRIESRLKPRCPGNEIAKLLNPLAKVRLYPASVLEGLVPAVPGRIIADSIRVRGMRHALAVFPLKIRKLIEKTLTGSASLLPDPEKIWAAWPNALIDVGLGEQLGAVKPKKPYSFAA
jgi:hypothetical protein